MWLLRVSVVAGAVAVYVWALPSALGLNRPSASNGYPYGYSDPNGNAYGQQKVPMCHNHRTILVPPPSVAAHLAKGDTIGACP